MEHLDRNYIIASKKQANVDISAIVNPLKAYNYTTRGVADARFLS
jgi:hypothetical protein